MKTENQIHTILKAFRVASLEDKSLIETFMLEKGISLKIRMRKKISLTPLSFETFKKWYYLEYPQKGDVIIQDNDGTIGIVKGIGIASIIFGVTLTKSGTLNTVESTFNRMYHKATDEDILKLQRILNSNNLAWSPFFNGLVNKAPLSNNQIRITRLGKTLGYGIFKEINSDNEIVMYCVKMNHEKLRYSLNEVIGNNDDYQLEVMTYQERQDFITELEKEGKFWNGHQRRIEPMNYRVKEGEIYFYINDFLEVIATKERNKPKDTKKYRKGNYYTDRKDAEAMIEIITATRNQQLIERKIEKPEKTRGKSKAKKS